MTEIINTSEQTQVKPGTSLVLISLAFMVFFLGASVPLGVYAYDSKNELVQAITILVVPFSLWGWISFLRKALRSIDLTIWSLGTTKVSLAAGFVAIVLLLIYGWTKSPGIWLAIEIGLAIYVLVLLVLNFKYTRSILLTLDVTVTQLFISLLAVLFAFWLYMRFSPQAKSEG